jgi:hypothetical protein
MSTEIIGLIGIVVVVILIFARMWIGLAIPLVGFVGIIIILGLEQAFSALATIPFVKVAFYPMSAIPLFILMGTLIANTGIGADLRRLRRGYWRCHGRNSCLRKSSAAADEKVRI